MQQLIAPPIVFQPKWGVSRSDDPLEIEADRVADQVMSMRDSQIAVTPMHSQLNRKCADYETPDIVHDVIRSSGQPIDDRSRAFFEARFGEDFSKVRIHADEGGAASAHAVNALAYTLGSHIAFAQSRYAPQSTAGRHLLAHELAHVVQQQAEPVAVQRQAAQTTQPPLNSVPGLGPTPTQEVADLISAGDFQGAVDTVTWYAGGGIAKNYSIDHSLLADGRMVYDQSQSLDGVTQAGAWDDDLNKAKPAIVTIGPSAFSSVSFLYAVVMHEYQHVLFQQSQANQSIHNRGPAANPDEVQAYAWNILHASETGEANSPDQIANEWNQLNESYSHLDAPTALSQRSLATRAYNKAKRLAQGATVQLDPFNP